MGKIVTLSHLCILYFSYIHPITQSYPSQLCWIPSSSCLFCVCDPVSSPGFVYTSMDGSLFAEVCAPYWWLHYWRNDSSFSINHYLHINFQNFYIYKLNHASEIAPTICFHIISEHYLSKIFPDHHSKGANISQICSGHLPSVHPEHLCCM